MGDTPTLPPSTTSLSVIPFPSPSKTSSSTSSTKGLEARPPTSKRSEMRRGKVTRRDRNRWRKWKAGESAEEIATHENVSVLAINASIQRFLAYQESVSHEAVDMKANELSIHTLERLTDVIDDVITAEKEQTYTDAAGNTQTRTVPDLKMRLTAFDKINKLIQSVRKSEGLTINQNNVQTNVQINAKKGLTVEERIRAVREKNRLKNDDNVIEAELIDEDEDETEYEGEEEDEAREEAEEDGE